eukprot:Gregarina_sp_Poly_1__2115@NODE_155_length_12405_cov_134_674339_g137_i0_p2_GENE_NODE_155_length_12405_cov_134_674339_g137_i0NODE_155_length_12405_cov_134_674339_g137_i0_p2_ORF_typecomplete_len719_score107_54TniQ/PF06527_11/0_022Zn_ribbon_SprT/PF17283_2/0_33Zn_ribbon_SprT/PF17283_2/9_9e03zinc_ribbon_9/PF14369_6/56zinc_ribbon_9/PF14369_6/30_NODE_155_length_12405_cov_134_674339_g137_i0919311349
MRSESTSTTAGIESWASRGVTKPSVEEAKKTLNVLVTAFDPRYQSPCTPLTEDGDLRSNKTNSPMSPSPSSLGGENEEGRPLQGGGEMSSTDLTVETSTAVYEGSTEVSSTVAGSSNVPAGTTVLMCDRGDVSGNLVAGDRFFLLTEKNETPCLVGSHGTAQDVSLCDPPTMSPPSNKDASPATIMSHRVAPQQQAENTYALLPVAADQESPSGGGSCASPSVTEIHYNDPPYSTPRSLLSMNYLPSSRASLESPTSQFPQSLGTYQSSLYPASSQPSNDSSNQKAVAFLAGPRERICVLGNPIEMCPRCRQEGFSSSSWRPHRHIGELKIRYICERHFEDLESPHHFDIPLCPLCNNVLYLYEFNALLGVSNARRLHKYVLKCSSRHVLPLLDLFCQTKKSGDRCNANFKLQWCYGTMVKRCESQKNRDHDLWWVRYKNEWKQRRTIIRYKKDFLSHLSDTQRGLLLGIGLEGEPPPDPKGTLGPTFDALISSSGGSPTGPKIKKRGAEKMAFSQLARSSVEDEFGDRDINQQYPSKRRQGTDSMFYHNHSLQAYSLLVAAGLTARQSQQQSSSQSPTAVEGCKFSLYSSGANVGEDTSAMDVGSATSVITTADKQSSPPYRLDSSPLVNGFPIDFAPNQVITGTPMNDLLQRSSDGRSPVAVSVTGDPCPPARSNNGDTLSRERKGKDGNLLSADDQMTGTGSTGIATIVELASPI